MKYRSAAEVQTALLSFVREKNIRGRIPSVSHDMVKHLDRSVGRLLWIRLRRWFFAALMSGSILAFVASVVIFGLSFSTEDAIRETIRHAVPLIMPPLISVGSLLVSWFSGLRLRRLRETREKLEAELRRIWGSAWPAMHRHLKATGEPLP